MPYSITDFSHQSRGYAPDSGGTFNVSLRTVYVGPSQLAAKNAGAKNFSSKHARRRYIFYQNTGTGNDLRRHYPVSIANATTPTAPGTIDGVPWVLKGYRGEQDRAS